ncbi:MAG: ATP-dependent DNA helicase RecG [Alphaproteobacteria bacterium]|nr:ATP-dependent DNA helicase RecG [Alphaproteobacteria bacterium]MBL6776934.1 ATP-dependent DNA helicase RecG [Alphaproteobacteria bacterium]
MHIPRPTSLYRLFASTSSLPGIGPKIAAIMEKRIGGHLIDILRHLPVSLNDRRARPSVDEAEDGQLATFEVLVLSGDIPPGKSNRPARITTETKGGRLELVFFRARADWLRQSLPIGERRLVSGRVERFQGRLQMAHPDFITSLEKASDIPEIEPIYPLTAGLSARILRRAILASLKAVPDLPEWIDVQQLRTHQWPSHKHALQEAHNPQEPSDLLASTPARTRLAYDELLANQFALGLLRRQTSAAGEGCAKEGSEKLTAALLSALPFTPTNAQMRVIAEIKADQMSEARMLRLLQGDVGSGKTFVALMAMLHALEAGYQAALLAPTEILARQHHASLSALLKEMQIEPELLLGGMKTKERKEVTEKLAAGSCQIVIGTHALLSDDIHFAKLGLAVVDEQHRFGVRQRLVLGQKGDGCDVLVMTATPIPRTLAMTAYGDLQVSRLDEKPKGRQEISTAAISGERIAEIVERLRQAVASQQRAYWICPLVEETDKLDVAAAEDRHRQLQAILPDIQIGLVHGRMKTDEREAAMAEFKAGKSQILIATTVIEVGVDVPEASIIIIEHAERFGLAQLHQLRGRVGRGSARSACILMYQAPLSEAAQARLKIMRATNDGFVIAEEDLRLRGPGEVLGQRQSGLPEFCLADLALHADLLPLARQQAENILEKGFSLDAPEMEPYVVLLSLFERDNAVRFLASG